MPFRRLFTAAALVASCLLAQDAGADLFYNVTIDTAGLTAAMDPSIALQLTDGSGLDDNNNAVTLSNFAFGGGSAASCAIVNNCEAIGGATGDLATGVTLRDSTFFNAYFQRFLPGSTLSFVLGFTTNLDAGGVPDAFGLNLLLGVDPIATLDALGTNTFIRFEIDSANPVLSVFGAVPGAADVGPPRVALRGPAAVPLPGTVALLGVASLALLGSRARRRVFR